MTSHEFRRFALQRMFGGSGMDPDEYERMLRNSYGRRYNRRTSGELHTLGPRGGPPMFGRSPRVRAPFVREVPMWFDPVSGYTTYGQRF